MPEITFGGIFNRSGIAGDPVVFIDEQDHARMNAWWLEHNIFTRILCHPHPTTGDSRPNIYIKGHDDPFSNGDYVSLTIDVRPEKRGNGIRTIRVIPH